MKQWVRFCALLGVLFTWMPITAHAQCRVIVEPFRGLRVGAIRTIVMEELQRRGCTVISQSEEGASESRGEARVVVRGHVSRVRRRIQARVEVRVRQSDQVLASVAVSGRRVGKVESRLRRTLWSRLGRAVSGESPLGPNSSEEGRSPAEGDATEDDAEDDASSQTQAATTASTAPRRPLTRSAPSPLHLALGIRGYAREFEYRDDILYRLMPYRNALWEWRASARWYPAAHATDEWIAHVGVIGSGGTLVLPFTSKLGATNVPTFTFFARGGLEVRLPFHPLEFAVSGEYGIHSFRLGPEKDETQEPVPSVEYQFVRPAVRARFDVWGGVYLEAAFGWMFVLQTGELAAWFPRSNGHGLDGSAHIGWESDLGLGIRLGFEISRYFFALNPTALDQRIAGGVADQSLSGVVDLTYALR